MTVYFITGCARGIGFELVSQLARNHSNTIIAAVRRTSDPLFALQQDHDNVRIVTCDVSSESSIASLPKNLGHVLGPDERLDYLINNAAIVAGPECKGLSVTAEALHDNVQTNLLGPALVVSKLVPFLAPNALVVNVSSGIGSLELVSSGRIRAYVTAYSISKAALNMLSVHQAQELKGKARVVCLDPGHAKTDLGGVNASLEVVDSAGGMISVLADLKQGEQEREDRERGRARFINYLGDELPW